MKNHREFLGVVANVLIVVIVLLIIIVGLNKIGVYSLPDWAEKILGTYTRSDNEASKNDKKIYDSLKYNAETEENLVVTTMTYENAYRALQNLAAVDNYAQNVTIDNISEFGHRTEKVSISRKNGLYNASVSDIYGNVQKKIEENDSYFLITDYYSGDEASSKIVKGVFDISDSCGFILDVDSFLKSGFNLDAASFSQSQNEYGTVITIAFKNTLGSVTQTEQYTISLDYGVVVSAFCFEDDTLVYAMTTEYLSTLAQ